MLGRYIYPVVNCYLKNLFSGICLLCKESTFSRFDLCKACEEELPYLGHTCIKCALPLKSAHQICIACLATKEEAACDVFSLFSYQFPIDRLITALKFRKQLNIATILGQLMANKMKKLYQNRQKPDVIIPVPLHSTRLKKRGFNQALEIAKPISQILAIAVDYYSCTRIRPTQPQTDLAAVVRSHNVNDAFTVAKRFHASRVCVIDDVFTTGNTTMALSKELLKTGVQSVDIWCCARTSLKRLVAQ